jgi:hypothetical protein
MDSIPRSLGRNERPREAAAQSPHLQPRPARRSQKVEQDIEKIAANLAGGACRLGYVMAFEECDHEFPKSFAAEAEAKNGCRVRFIRGYS